MTEQKPCNPSCAPGYCYCKEMTEQPKQEQYTYTSTQATTCAVCAKHKHTPLRIDAMGGYVCLTCIDKKLGSLLGEFGHSGQQKREWVALTDEQIKELYSDDDNFRMTKEYVVAFARAIESKLREKNT